MGEMNSLAKPKLKAWHQCRLQATPINPAPSIESLIIESREDRARAYYQVTILALGQIRTRLFLHDATAFYSPPARLFRRSLQGCFILTVSLPGQIFKLYVVHLTHLQIEMLACKVL